MELPNQLGQIEGAQEALYLQIKSQAQTHHLPTPQENKRYSQLLKIHNPLDHQKIKTNKTNLILMI
jgi:hypothetical protein